MLGYRVFNRSKGQIRGVNIIDTGFDKRSMPVYSEALTCPPKRSPVIMLVNWDKKGG